MALIAAKRQDKIIKSNQVFNNNDINSVSLFKRYGYQKIIIIVG